MPRKSTTDVIFALRMLMEKYREGQSVRQGVDRETVILDEEVWSGREVQYVRLVKDVNETVGQQ